MQTHKTPLCTVFHKNALFLETHLSAVEAYSRKPAQDVCLCPPAWVRLNSPSWMWTCMHRCMIWNCIKGAVCMNGNSVFFSWWMCSLTMFFSIYVFVSDFGIVFCCMDGQGRGIIQHTRFAVYLSKPHSLDLIPVFSIDSIWIVPLFEFQV